MRWQKEKTEWQKAQSKGQRFVRRVADGSSEETRARRGKTMQCRVMTSSVALLRQTNQARMQESS